MSLSGCTHSVSGTDKNLTFSQSSNVDGGLRGWHCWKVLMQERPRKTAPPINQTGRRNFLVQMLKTNRSEARDFSNIFLKNGQNLYGFLQFYTNIMHHLPSKLKPPGPPKNALKMLLASKSGGDTEKQLEDRTSPTTRTFFWFTHSRYFDKLFSRIVYDKQQRFPPLLTSHVHAVIL